MPDGTGTDGPGGGTPPEEPTDNVTDLPGAERERIRRDNLAVENQIHKRGSIVGIVTVVLVFAGLLLAIWFAAKHRPKGAPIEVFVTQAASD